MIDSNRKQIPTGYLAVFLIFSGVWLVCHHQVILRFRMLDSDSIMYGLPLAFAHHPFDLKIPWIGQFLSYGSDWGHSWPGALWLRASLYSIIPFSRSLDIVLLLLALWATATLTARTIWRATSNLWMTGISAVILLSDRALIAGIQLHRFETIGILMVTALFVFVLECSNQMSGRMLVLGCLASFFAPCVHPVGIPMGGLLIAFLLWKAFILRSVPIPTAIIAATCALAGVAALILWFYLQPGAWAQFSLNLKIQQTFQMGYNAVWKGLGGYRFWNGRILWSVCAISAVLLLTGFARNLKSCFCPSTVRWMPPLIFFGHAAFHTVTQGPNYQYLAFEFPVGLFMLASVLESIRMREWTALYRFGVTASLLVAAIFSIILPYRLLGFARAGFPNFPVDCSMMLTSIPAGRTVFIPPPLWGAAIMDHQHQWRLSTLAVITPKEMRGDYEKNAYADLKKGDVLIFDRHAQRGIAPDTKMHHWLPTFQHANLDPNYWKFLKKEQKDFPGSDNSFGYDLDFYEFLGGSWRGL